MIFKSLLCIYRLVTKTVAKKIPDVLGYSLSYQILFDTA
jgi:hypothetical protein